MVLPMNGVRPSPPPTMTSKPVSPAPLRCIRNPMSCTRTAARSCAAAVTAILNLRGRNENSGCSVVNWRRISAQMRGSSISSVATPAHWSVVMLRTQLPMVCMPCRPARARSAMASGSSASLIQLNWMFCRVVKWP